MHIRLMVLGLWVAWAACLSRAGFDSWSEPEPDLRIDSITPRSGPIDGGNPVEIRGYLPADVAEVTLGDTPCTGVVLHDRQGLTCTTQAHPPAVVDVSVRSAQGETVRLANEYAYYVPDTPDATFGDDGQVIIDYAGGDDRFWDAITVQAGDSLLGSGWIETNGRYQMALVRILENGDRDPAFGTNGILGLDTPGTATGWACDHAVTSNGQIVAVGNSDDSDGERLTQVARITSDGALDAGFGDGGFVVLNLAPGDEQSCAVELTTDGSIIVVGFSMNVDVSNSLVHVVKLLPNGQSDTRFGNGSEAIIDTFDNDIPERAYDHLVLPDDRILVGFSPSDGTDLYPQLVALTEEGQVDSSFGDDGFLALPMQASGHSPVNRLGLDTSGRILVIGSNGGDLVVWRLTAGGVLDTTFGSNGAVFYDAGATESGYSVQEAEDHTLIAAGDIRDAANDANDFLLVRFLEDGSLDTTFGTGGRVVLDIFGFLDRPYDIELDSRGRIVVSGQTSNGVDNDMVVIRRWP